MASMTEPSASEVVRMTTLPVAPRAMSSRVVAEPLRPGICTSRRRTSAGSAALRASASLPSAARQMISMSGCAPSSVARPMMCSGSSSARPRRITGASPS